MAERTPIGRNIPFPSRGMYYPAWAPSYEGLEDLKIKSADGEPYYHGDPDEEGNKRPVTLSDVAPERRWAVDFDTGRILNQRDFSDMHLAWINYICKSDGRVVAMNAENKYFDPSIEPVPNAEEFVLRQPDGTQATWKKLRVGDFKPPAQKQNENLIAQLVEGLGGAMSGFVQQGKPVQSSTLGNAAEVRPKFEKVPSPSEG